MKDLLKLNLGLFVAYAALTALAPTQLGSFYLFHVGYSLVALALMLGLPALNVTALLQFFLPRRLRMAEWLTIASALGLMVAPGLLAIENIKLRDAGWLPLLNTTLLSLLFVCWAAWYPRSAVSTFSWRSVWAVRRTPLLWITLLYL